VKIGQIYQREPSASFLAVVEPDWTYTTLFELAVEYGYLENEMFDFVRFLVQVKRKIESIMDAEAHLPIKSHIFGSILFPRISGPWTLRKNASVNCLLLVIPRPGRSCSG
jgi:hypothetical protein